MESVIDQFQGASFEILHGVRSTEIICVLFNYADLPQLRGVVKSAVEEHWTSENLRISERDRDSHFPLIIQLSPLELRAGEVRKRSAKSVEERKEKKSARSWTKKRRK